MKKIFVVFFLLAAGVLFSQEPLFKEITQRLRAEYPELNLSDKLLVINVWTASDMPSRERNQDLQKAGKAFSNARLKGGKRGMVAVSICLDPDPGIQVTALSRDGVSDVYAVSVKGLNKPDINKAIFDSKGTLLKKDFSTKIFDEVHNLITR